MSPSLVFWPPWPCPILFCSPYASSVQFGKRNGGIHQGIYSPVYKMRQYGIGDVQHSIKNKAVWNRECTAQSTESGHVEKRIYSAA